VFHYYKGDILYIIVLIIKMLNCFDLIGLQVMNIQVFHTHSDSYTKLLYT